MYRISFRYSKDCTIYFYKLNLIIKLFKPAALCANNRIKLTKTDGWLRLDINDRDLAVKVLALLKETMLFDTQVVKL